MKFSDFVIKGINAAGGTADKLALRLGVTRTNIQDAKAARRGLPVAACYILAQMIAEDERAVVAASELVTEKNADRRAALLPFVERRAAAWLYALIMSGVIGVGALPSESRAATDSMTTASGTMYIMSSRKSPHAMHLPYVACIVSPEEPLPPPFETSHSPLEGERRCCRS